MAAAPAPATHLKCSFCGKNRRQVDGLATVAAVTVERSGETAAICSQCLELCDEIVAEELGPTDNS